MGGKGGCTMRHTWTEYDTTGCHRLRHGEIRARVYTQMMATYVSYLRRRSGGPDGGTWHGWHCGHRGEAPWWSSTSNPWRRWTATATFHLEQADAIQNNQIFHWLNWSDTGMMNQSWSCLILLNLKSEPAPERDPPPQWPPPAWPRYSRAPGRGGSVRGKPATFEIGVLGLRSVSSIKSQKADTGSSGNAIDDRLHSIHS